MMEGHTMNKIGSYFKLRVDQITLYSSNRILKWKGWSQTQGCYSGSNAENMQQIGRM